MQPGYWLGLSYLNYVIKEALNWLFKNLYFGAVSVFVIDKCFPIVALIVIGPTLNTFETYTAAKL